MPNTKNKQTLEQIKTKLQQANSLVFTEYHGLKARELNDLRAKAKDAGAEVLVAKNTLLRIALREKGLGEKIAELKGPVATIIGHNDPISPIKVLTEFTKKLQLPKIKFGIVENLYVNESKISELSNIPEKPVLVGKLLGSLKSPMAGITSVLAGTQRKFVYSLAEIAKKKGV